LIDIFRHGDVPTHRTHGISQSAPGGLCAHSLIRSFVERVDGSIVIGKVTRGSFTSVEQEDALKAAARGTCRKGVIGANPRAARLRMSLSGGDYPKEPHPLSLAVSTSTYSLALALSWASAFSFGSSGPRRD
jgi:hypothetical protein